MSDTSERPSTWTDLANPTRFVGLADRLVPFLAGLSALILAIGLYMSFAAPADYQQGTTVRIMYIHVPFAWLAMLCYSLMAASALGTLVWRHPLADVALKSAAPIGAVFTALALITGSIWGKPMWGTWWVWDARLTSELILLFLYLGYIAFRASFDDLQRADRASAILAIVGVINVPIIHYSVEWWTTLHQPASVTRFAKPTIAMSMLVPLFIMLVGYQLYFAWVLCRRLQGEIVRRERAATWLQTLDGNA
jgi:heme exporter protein C